MNNNCVECTSKRGKLVSLGCSCIAHKRCASMNILKKLETKTEICNRCKQQISKPHGLIVALRNWLKPNSPYKIKFNSLVPVIFYHDSQTEGIGNSDKWKSFCLEQLCSSPSWAHAALTRSSKKSICYIYSGSKWD